MYLVELGLGEAGLLRQAVMVLLHPVTHQTLFADGCQRMVRERGPEVEPAPCAAVSLVWGDRVAGLRSVVSNTGRSGEAGPCEDDGIAAAPPPHLRERSRLLPEDLGPVHVLASAVSVVAGPGLLVARGHHPGGFPRSAATQQAVPLPVRRALGSFGSHGADGVRRALGSFGSHSANGPHDSLHGGLVDALCPQSAKDFREHALPDLSRDLQQVLPDLGREHLQQGDLPRAFRGCGPLNVCLLLELPGV
mmetsp:Transcript_57533/g.180739  ORF Transcript_57533/g.180739 Transcript_57533/m.180739 type:complete len:249 (+) Transcript_57533:682-1428(+)